MLTPCSLAQFHLDRLIDEALLLSPNQFYHATVIAHADPEATVPEQVCAMSTSPHNPSERARLARLPTSLGPKLSIGSLCVVKLVQLKGDADAKDILALRKLW